jgi:hypothetical protein
MPVEIRASFFSVRYARLMFNCNELPREVVFTPAFFAFFDKAF